MDAPRQPGAQRPSRLHLRARRYAARASGACRRSRRVGAEALRAHRQRDRDRAKGAALERINFRHPFYDRAAPVYLGDYVTLEQGTGIVHSSPAYGVEDFLSCRSYGMKDDDILNPVTGRRPLCQEPRSSSAARTSGRRIRRSSRRSAKSARCSTPRSSRTATCTAGVTRHRSSIARPRSGSRAWTTCPATRA